MRWELDLWYEMWDRAGSQGLDTWYAVGGRPEAEPERKFDPGSNEVGLDGGVLPADAGGGPE